MDSTALALTLIGFGVLLIVLSYQRHRQLRDVSALLHGVIGAALAIAGVLLLTFTLNFDTYDALQAEQPLAELTVEQSGPQLFNVHLMRIPAGDLQVFVLKGDTWQIEARILQWQGWTRWMGLSSNIRLERLKSNETAAPGIGNSYLLNRTAGLRLVALQQRFPNTFDFLHSHTLQTAPSALQDGLRFQLFFSDGQLLARAINQPKATKH